MGRIWSRYHGFRLIYELMRVVVCYVCVSYGGELSSERVPTVRSLSTARLLSDRHHQLFARHSTSRPVSQHLLRLTAFSLSFFLIAFRLSYWPRADSRFWITRIIHRPTQRCDKSRICPDHPRCAPPTKVVMWGGVADVVNHAKFHPNRLRGFGSLRGQNLPFSYT